MRAVVLDDAGQPALSELPEPSGPGPRLHVLASGLCGSDVEKLGRAPAGTVLGHEVVAAEEDGHRVVLVHHLPCGECQQCVAGHESLCPQFAAPTIFPGGFAERVRAQRSIDLPADVDATVGALAEPLACVLRGAERIEDARRVLVVGCGFIGLLFVEVLRRRAVEVVVRDPREDRLELARSLGARVEGGFFDAAVVTAHGGVNEALSALVPGSVLLLFAAPADPVPIDVDALYRRELGLFGSRSATPRHMREAVRILPSLEPLPLTVLPLEQFAEGVELYRRGEALKVVFEP